MNKKQEDDLLRKYHKSKFDRNFWKDEKDIDRIVNKWVENNEGMSKKQDLLSAKLELRLNKKQKDMREKALLAHFMYDDEWHPYDDLETCPEDRKAKLKKGIDLMGELTKYSLDDIKKVLTELEFGWFKPIYEKFKKTGKFSIFGYRG